MSYTLRSNQVSLASMRASLVLLLVVIVEYTRVVRVLVQRRGNGSDGVDFAIQILIMVAIIPVAIGAWVAVDTTSWGSGAIALWNLGVIVIVAVMIYWIYARLKTR